MESENTLNTLLDREAIRRLKYRYCFAIDEKRCADFVDLFTRDATIDYATRGTYQGRVEIQNFIEEHVTEADQMAHTALNPIIDINGDTATGKWYGIVLIENGDSTLFGQGRYDESYQRTEKGWKFTSLKTNSRFSMQIDGI